MCVREWEREAERERVRVSVCVKELSKMERVCEKESESECPEYYHSPLKASS